MIFILMLFDLKFDEIYLSNFVMINVFDVICCILGVGCVLNIGSCYYVM